MFQVGEHALQGGVAVAVLAAGRMHTAAPQQTLSRCTAGGSAAMLWPPVCALAACRRRQGGAVSAVAAPYSRPVLHGCCCRHCPG